MENKKVNFFAIPVFSFVPTKYNKLVKEKGGKIFGALLIAFIVMAIINCITFSISFKDVTNVIAQQCPDFELSNGELRCDQVVDIDEEGVFIRIDDSVPGVSLNEFQELVASKRNVGSAIYAGSESLCMYSTSNGFQQIKYADFDASLSATGKTLAFSKDTLIDAWLPLAKSFIYVALFIGAFVAIGMHYFWSLILRLVTYVTCSASNKNLESNEQYRLTVLAKFAVYVCLWIVGQFVAIPSSFLVSAVLSAIFIIIVTVLYKEDMPVMEYSEEVQGIEDNYSDMM